MPRRTLSPRSLTARTLAVVVTVIASLLAAACTSDDGPSIGAPTTIPVATTVTTAPSGPAPECTPEEAVASYQPSGSLPAPGDMPPGTAMADIQARGRLIVGVSADTKLFGARNPIEGGIEGFDIDILKEVALAIFGGSADEIDSRIEYRVINYAQRLPSLENGSVDLVAHTMTINCERWQRIAFSTEYYPAGQKVLVGLDLVDDGIDDVSKLDGQKICAAEGSTNIDNIRAYPVEVVGAPDLTDCLVLFQQGAVDGITGDDTVLAGFVAQDPYAKVIGETPFTSEPYGIGVRLDQPDLVRFVNLVLEDVRTSGRWNQIFDRWLGGIFVPPPPIPQAVYGRTP